MLGILQDGRDNCHVEREFQKSWCWIQAVHIHWYIAVLSLMASSHKTNGWEFSVRMEISLSIQ